MLEDRFGNWSESVTGNWALVDLTPPDDIIVEISYNSISFGDELIVFNDITDQRFMVSETAINGIALYSVDSDSGVIGYRWYIDDAQALPGENIPDELLFTNLDTPTYVYSETELTCGGQSFDNGSEYRVFFSFRNQAGIDSNWNASPVVCADFSAPLVSFESVEGGERMRRFRRWC